MRMCVRYVRRSLAAVGGRFHLLGQKVKYSTIAANKLLTLVEEHGLIQHVNEPTRKQGNANNILDLVFRCLRLVKVQRHMSVADDFWQHA